MAKNLSIHVRPQRPLLSGRSDTGKMQKAKNDCYRGQIKGR